MIKHSEPHSPLSRRGALALLGGLAAVPALASCANSSAGAASTAAATPTATVDAAALKQVTLKVGDQKANLKAVLGAAGLLDDLPYSLSWSTFSSGPPLLEAVQAGAIDIGGVGNTPPIFAGAAGAKLAVVSAVKDDADSDAILVPKNSPIRSVAELEGKTVAVAKGSSAHGHLLQRLNQANLVKGNKVKIVFVSPSDGYAAFGAGRVDAWAVWDPYTAQAQQEIGARILVAGTGVANGLGFQVASLEALGDPARNTAIRDLVTRTAKARLWAADHTDAWAAVQTKETGLPLTVTRISAKRGKDIPVPLSKEIIDSEQQLTDALAEAKVIPKRFEFANLVDHRFDADIAALSRKA